MGTPRGDPFQDHLLDVLRLRDSPPPIPRYNRPRDWQTDAILSKVLRGALPKNIVSDGHGLWTIESEVSPSVKSTDVFSDATLSIDDSSSYTDSEPDYHHQKRKRLPRGSGVARKPPKS
ncbi:hypothetical protein K438DRAFT_1983234 [Mycena galopus ATCC 62051]|nr:hypothetical protein K438DRAFT_1983234 [Mycena galopus ATCC 62051]